MTATSNWNDGKDLMPEDITVEEIKGNYHAFLSFAPFGLSDLPIAIPANGRKMKFFTAQGSTEKAARNELIDLMIEHLTRLKL